MTYNTILRNIGIDKQRVTFQQMLLIGLLVYVTVLTTRLVIFHFSLGIHPRLILPSGEYIPLWTNDAGLYGYYAKQILQGTHYPYIAEYMPGHLLAFLAKITPFSLNQLLFYTPVFISSLIVLPVVFLGFLSKYMKLCVYSALLGSLGLMFYVRTGFGYYDTDFLNTVFLVSISVSMMFVLVRTSAGSIAFASVLMLGFGYWYHSSSSLVLYLLGLFILGNLLIGKKPLSFFALLPFGMALLPFGFASKVLLLGGSILLVHFLCRGVLTRYVVPMWYYKIGMLIVSLASFLIVFFNQSYYERALDYFEQEQEITITQINGQELYFTSELSDVSEASKPSVAHLSSYFFPFAMMIVFALLGIVLLSFQSRVLLIYALSFVFFFIAIFAGLRFGTYATFALSLGIAYWFCKSEQILQRWKRPLKYIAPLAFAALFAVYSKHIFTTNEINTTLTQENIIALQELDQQASEKDFMLTSWTFGWPIWYYTKLNTLIDNGKRNYDKYIISKLLFSKPEHTAKAARFFLEQCKDRRCTLMEDLLKTTSLEDIEQSITQANETVKKTKELYFFLHERMILSARHIILDMLVKDKEQPTQKQDFFTSRITNLGSVIISDLFEITQKTKSIKVLKSNQTVTFNTLQAVDINGGMQRLRGDQNSSYHVIVYKRQWLLVMHTDIFESFFIQAFVLGNIDKNLFELEATTATSKIIRVKD